MIKLQNISFSYKENLSLLNSVNYNFEKGVYFILGNNGIGKSTLLKIIMGILTPNEGKVLLNNKDVTCIKRGELARSMGYLSSDIDYQLFANCVYDEIFFPLQYILKDKEKAEKQTEIALENFRLIHLLDKPPLRLSEGEKKRLLLACISSLQVNTLILDEPSASLDEFNRKFLANYLNQIRKDKLIIIATHDKEFIDAVEGKILKMTNEGNIYEN